MTLRGPLIAPALLFVVSVVLATRTYVQVMYDGELSFVSLTEGANYAVQTATTVGYGNWETPIFKQDAPEVHGNKVFQLRMWSVLYMLIGATIYTLLTGVIVSIFVKRFDS